MMQWRSILRTNSGNLNNRALVVPIVKSLRDFIVFFAVILIAGSRRELTVARDESLEFVAGGHDETEEGRRGEHGSSEVLWMELHCHKIRMVCGEEEIVVKNIQRAKHITGRAAFRGRGKKRRGRVYAAKLLKFDTL